MNPTDQRRWKRGFLLAALLGLAGAAILVVSLPQRQRRVDGEVPRPSDEPPERRTGTVPPLESPGEPRPAETDSASPTPAVRSGAQEVRGRLTGRLEPPAGAMGGALQPATWFLVVRADGGFARETDPGAAGEEASLELSLGTYEVSARAPGFGAAWQTVALTREHPSASVSFALEPLLTLPGHVLDPSGDAVRDLAVSLLGPAGEVASTARTDFAGHFVLPEVLPGHFDLVLGDPAGPVAPPRAIVVDASLSLGTLLVPELSSLLVRVLDEEGVPVADAIVEGAGSAGGHLSGTSDFDGELRAEHLPAGDYRLFARHPELGRGTIVLEFDAGAERVVEIPLVRAKAYGG